ncbi:hypothetical protein P43SY_003185 [Pythium insidiosum]|uniref:Peroxisomal trans-2-enoyl-CoA reductase n=1 Tax=Pythium insidiosum TaxID=114742 RepID=A0AAD5M145_PYTIN|nr:hypothetical protein P43SY_003185 [Pythium insidiosum]
MPPLRATDSPSIYRAGLFDGKVAIVTGGGTGIGKCIAHELASLGCKVVIAARNEERLRRTADAIRDELARAGVAGAASLVHAVACDIRKEEQVAAMVQETIERFHRIDFLVNNAGGQFRALIEDMKTKGWEAAHGGNIVNIILVLDKGYPMMAHSAAARAGIENLTKSLSVEWASSGIRLNCVAPGIILSSGADNYEGGEQLFHVAAQRATCAKRVGSVEEVSAAVLYYLSPAAAYSTGTTLHVDGGWHLLGPLIDIPEHDNAAPYGSVSAKL